MFEFYVQYELWFARLQLICFMLGMGVNLAISDFAKVARKPVSLAIGLVQQVCLIPLVALAVNHLFGLAPAIALGLILVAAMPGGSLAKVFVYIGRGNAPLTITICAFATLATVVTVPATLRLLAAEYVPADFTMPVMDIIAEVLIFLLAPVAVGMVTSRIWPNARRTINVVAVRIGFACLAVIIVGSIGAERIRPGEHGMVIPIAIILFCVAGQQLSMLPFYLLPLPRADRLAIGIEVTMRNINLALLLNATMFRDRPELFRGVLFSILFYAAVALVIAVPLTLNHRRLSRREQHASQAAATEMSDLRQESA